MTYEIACRTVIATTAVRGMSTLYLWQQCVRSLLTCLGQGVRWGSSVVMSEQLASGHEQGRGVYSKGFAPAEANHQQIMMMGIFIQ